MKPDFEIRSDGDEYHLSGYASVFDTPYEVSTYTEEVKRGAFRRSLNAEPNVVLLINHQGLPIARTTTGTLKLAEDRIGLRIEANLDKTDPDVLAVAPKLRRGDLSEMSFSFRAIDQEWSDDFTKRRILQAEITRGDVSLVTFPANPATSAALRSAELTLEQRKARAESIGQELRAGVTYTRTESTGAGAVFSRVLAEPSPLDTVEPMTGYWQRVADLRDGTPKTGDAVADARALLDRGRNAAIQGELAEHRERIARDDRERGYDRLARERRWRQYG